MGEEEDAGDEEGGPVQEGLKAYKAGEGKTHPPPISLPLPRTIEVNAPISPTP